MEKNHNEKDNISNDTSQRAQQVEELDKQSEALAEKIAHDAQHHRNSMEGLHILSNLTSQSIKLPNLSLYGSNPLIGQGSFGVVLRMKHDLDLTLRAVKILTSIPSHKNKTNFLTEVQRLAQLQEDGLPENIVRYYDSGLDVKDPNNPFITYTYISMELINGRSLKEIMTSSDRCSFQKINEQTVFRWMCQMAGVLDHCHTKSNILVIHGDIKPENILIQTNPRGNLLKLVDFGLGFTERYCAYERRNFSSLSNEYDGRHDVWCTGCTFLELLWTKLLSEGIREDPIVLNSYENKEKKKVYQIWSHSTEDRKDFYVNNVLEHFPVVGSVIKKLLILHPKDRPTSSQFCKLVDEKTVLDKIKRILSPPEINFDHEIITYCNRFVTGSRAWMYEKVMNFFHPSDEHRMLWIIAEAGMGKSSFLATLVNHPELKSHIATTFFCKFNTIDRSEPKRILYYIVYQLVLRFPTIGYRLLDIVTNSSTNDIPSRSISIEDIVQSLIIDPLKYASNTEDGHEKHNTIHAIVIDALDEISVEKLNERKSLLEAVKSLTKYLPTWIKLIVSSRRDHDIIKEFSSFNPLIIEHTDEKHREDLCKFIESKLHHHLVNPMDMKNAVDILLDYSEGRFIYIEMISKNFEGDKKYTIEELTLKLPSTLNLFYLDYFKRMKESIESRYPDIPNIYEERIKPLVALLITTLDSKTYLSDVERILKIDPTDMNIYATHLTSLFPIHGIGNETIDKLVDVSMDHSKIYFTVYHKTVGDWLNDKKATSGFHKIVATKICYEWLSTIVPGNRKFDLKTWLQKLFNQQIKLISELKLLSQNDWNLIGLPIGIKNSIVNSLDKEIKIEVPYDYYIDPIYGHKIVANGLVGTIVGFTDRYPTDNNNNNNNNNDNSITSSNHDDNNDNNNSNNNIDQNNEFDTSTPRWKFTFESPYLINYLVIHLEKAKEIEKAYYLMLQLPWLLLSVKNRPNGVLDVISDFQRLENALKILHEEVTASNYTKSSAESRISEGTVFSNRVLSGKLLSQALEMSSFFLQLQKRHQKYTDIDLVLQLIGRLHALSYYDTYPTDPFYSLHEIVADCDKYYYSNLDITDCYYYPVKFDLEAPGGSLQSEIRVENSITAIISIGDDKIVTGDKNGSIIIWDMTKKISKGKLEGHIDEISNFILYNDEILLSSSWDNTIKVWDVNNLTCLTSFNDHECGVLSMAILSNFMLFSDKLVDSDLSNTKLDNLNPSSNTLLNIIPSSTILVSGSCHGDCIVWNLSSFRKLFIQSTVDIVDMCPIDYMNTSHKPLSMGIRSSPTIRRSYTDKMSKSNQRNNQNSSKVRRRYTFDENSAKEMFLSTETDKAIVSIIPYSNDEVILQLGDNRIAIWRIGTKFAQIVLLYKYERLIYSIKAYPNQKSIGIEYLNSNQSVSLHVWKRLEKDVEEINTEQKRITRKSVDDVSWTCTEAELSNGITPLITHASKYVIGLTPYNNACIIHRHSITKNQIDSIGSTYSIDSIDSIRPHHKVNHKENNSFYESTIGNIHNNFTRKICLRLSNGMIISGHHDVIKIWNPNYVVDTMASYYKSSINLLNEEKASSVSSDVSSSVSSSVPNIALVTPTRQSSNQSLTSQDRSRKYSTISVDEKGRKGSYSSDFRISESFRMSEVWRSSTYSEDRRFSVTLPLNSMSQSNLVQNSVSSIKGKFKDMSYLPNGDIIVSINYEAQIFNGFNGLSMQIFEQKRYPVTGIAVIPSKYFSILSSVLQRSRFSDGNNFMATSSFSPRARTISDNSMSSSPRAKSGHMSFTRTRTSSSQFVNLTVSPTLSPALSSTASPNTKLNLKDNDAIKSTTDETNNSSIPQKECDVIVFGLDNNLIKIFTKSDLNDNSYVEIYTIRHHNGPITCIGCVVNENNLKIVSGSKDFTLKVYDMVAEQTVQTFTKHQNIITCVLILSDQRIVSGSDDTLLYILSSDDFSHETNNILELRGHNGSIQTIAELTEHRIASGSSDRTIRIWSTISGAQLILLTGHTDSIRYVLFIGDNSNNYSDDDISNNVSYRILSESDDNTTRVWDISNPSDDSIKGIVVRDRREFYSASPSIPAMKLAQLVSKHNISSYKHNRIEMGPDDRIAILSKQKLFAFVPKDLLA